MDILEVVLGIVAGAAVSFLTSFGGEALRVAFHPAERRAFVEKLKAGDSMFDTFESYMRKPPKTASETAPPKAA